MDWRSFRAHSVALVHIEETESDFTSRAQGEGQYDYGAEIKGGSFVVGDLWAKKQPRVEDTDYPKHTGFNFGTWRSDVPTLGQPSKL